MAGTQALWPSNADFQGALAGNQIRSRAAGTQTWTLILDVSIASHGLILCATTCAPLQLFYRKNNKTKQKTKPWSWRANHLLWDLPSSCYLHQGELWTEASIQIIVLPNWLSSWGSGPQCMNFPGTQHSIHNIADIETWWILRLRINISSYPRVFFSMQSTSEFLNDP